MVNGIEDNQEEVDSAGNEIIFLKSHRPGSFRQLRKEVSRDIIALMAVKIRLRQVGKKHQRSYWIVATDSRAKRDGKYLEKLGFYNPNFAPPKVKINKKRLNYWLSVGGQPTEGVKKIIK